MITARRAFGVLCAATVLFAGPAATTAHAEDPIDLVFHALWPTLSRVCPPLELDCRRP